MDLRFDCRAVTGLCCLLVVLAAPTAWAADAADHPASKAVDYEAHYQGPDDDGQLQDFTVLNHGGRHLRRRVRDGRASSDYLWLEKPSSLSIVTNEDGVGRLLGFHSAGDEPRRETVFGSEGGPGRAGKEACRWYDVSHRQIDPPAITSRSWECYSNDGILIIDKWSSQGAADGFARTVALSVARRPVGIDEISPPRSLLDPDAWVVPPRMDYPGARRHADYVVTYRRTALRTGTDTGVTVERKRHFPWVFAKASNAAGLIRAQAWSDVEPIGWSMQMPVDNQSKRFLALRLKWSDPDAADFRVTLQIELLTTPRREEGREVILGEECRWYHMTPDVSDAGQRQCLTDDMVPLAMEDLDYWGGAKRMTAVKVIRRPVSFDEMKPPKAWFELSYWGLAQ